MDWYVVQTFSGYENTVKRNLEERIKGQPFEPDFGEILVPSEQVTERRGKKNIKTNKKFFPGYIFVNMELNERTWHVIANTPKVTGFLGGKKPKPVPAPLMEAVSSDSMDEGKNDEVTSSESDDEDEKQDTVETQTLSTTEHK